jgi:hypothetical protein
MVNTMCTASSNTKDIEHMDSSNDEHIFLTKSFQNLEFLIFQTHKKNVNKIKN